MKRIKNKYRISNLIQDIRLFADRHKNAKYYQDYYNESELRWLTDKGKIEQKSNQRIMILEKELIELQEKVSNIKRYNERKLKNRYIKNILK